MVMCGDGLSMFLLTMFVVKPSLRGAAAIQYVNSQYIRITIANIAFV